MIALNNGLYHRNVVDVVIEIVRRAEVSWAPAKPTCRFKAYARIL